MSPVIRHWHLVMTLAAVLVLRCSAISLKQTVIPKPNGTYGVNLKVMKLTDQSRIDPYAPTRQPRSVMVSAFYPSSFMSDCRPKLAEYAPRKSAAFLDQYFSPYGTSNGTFEVIRLEVCQDDRRVTRHLQDFYVVLFSPGAGTPRLLYSAIAQAVASHGNIVVTIDHPYDAAIVEYPDGQSVLGLNISSVPELPRLTEVRAQDASFVLDQLSLPKVASQLLPCSGDRLKTDRAVIFGHSIGGAEAAATMLNDSRVIGGADLDGTIWGPVVEKGLDRPFLIFSSAVSNSYKDASWKAIWSHLRGWKLELVLQNSVHDTFSDYPLLADLAGVKVPGASGSSLQGSIGGARAFQVIKTYIAAFIDFVHNGTSSELLQGPAQAFPDVWYNVTSNNTALPSR